LAQTVTFRENNSKSKPGEPNYMTKKGEEK